MEERKEKERNETGKEMKIERMYVDFTFGSSPFWQFPSISQSIKTIIDLISSYPSYYEIYLEFDMIGLEPLLLSLSSFFSSPVLYFFLLLFFFIFFLIYLIIFLFYLIYFIYLFLI